MSINGLDSAREVKWRRHTLIFNKKNSTFLYAEQPDLEERVIQVSEGFGVANPQTGLSYLGITGNHYFNTFEVWGEAKSLLWVQKNFNYSPRLTLPNDLNLVGLVVPDPYLFGLGLATNIINLTPSTALASLTSLEDNLFSRFGHRGCSPSHCFNEL